MVNHKKSNKTQKHTKKQKMYHMKGCSSSCKIKSHNHKKYLGGYSALAYPSADVPKTINPFLAYTGSPNIDAKSSIHPSAGPAPGGFNFLNPQDFLHGGKNKKSQKGRNCGCDLTHGKGHKCGLEMKGRNCGCDLTHGKGHKCGLEMKGRNCGCDLTRGKSHKCGLEMKGGNCGCDLTHGKGHKCGLEMKGGNCGCNLQSGGGHKCGKMMKGGACYSGNGGIPYPNGLLGKPWTPNPAGWPGVGNVAMNRNHLGYNTYSPVDISREMVDVFPNPFKLIGGRKNKKLNKNNKTKKIKGGAMSNLLSQDLINLGRQVQYGIGSAYNTVLGYPSPVNPMPWKGQFQNNI
jgi:hypothetical protein